MPADTRTPVRPAATSGRAGRGSSGGLTVVEQDALGAHRDRWDELVLASRLPTPFLRAWWLDAVSTTSDRYVLVLDGEELVGGLALERRTRWGIERYRFLGGGTLCPDHLDLVVAPGREDEVATALRTWFARRWGRLLDLRGVAEDAVVLGVFPRWRSEDDGAPYEPLPESVETFLARRSKNFRRSALRAERQFAQHGAVSRRLELAEIPEALADFADIQRRRSGREALLSEMPRIERAVVAGARAGEARVLATDVDGERAAVVVAFATAGRLGLYQVARRTEQRFSRVGTVVAMAMVRDAIATGMGEVDFLRGDEAYKFAFAGERRTLWRIRAGSDPVTLLAAGGWVLIAWLRSRLGAGAAKFSEILGSIGRHVALVGHVQSWKVLGGPRRDATGH